MAIEPRAEPRPGVVQVKGHQLPEADGAVELVEHCRQAPGGPDVVPGGEEVARVEAQRQTLRSSDSRQDRAELLRPRPERVPGAGRVLESDAHAPSIGAMGDLVQRTDEAGEPRLGAL